MVHHTRAFLPSIQVDLLPLLELMITVFATAYLCQVAWPIFFSFSAARAALSSTSSYFGFSFFFFFSLGLTGSCCASVIPSRILYLYCY